MCLYQRAMVYIFRHFNLKKQNENSEEQNEGPEQNI